MKRITLLFLVVLSLAVPIHPRTQPAKPPNILFLFADDMRADTIAAWGNPHITTPNLDGLVRHGFSFRGNYIFGGNQGAVCVPSRAMLMSGKTWFRIDAPTLKGTKLLPELLGEKGYVTFATGKWHNGEASWLRDSVFLPYIEVQRAVRDRRWKLVAYPKIGHLQAMDEFLVSLGYLKSATAERTKK